MNCQNVECIIFSLKNKISSIKLWTWFCKIAIFCIKIEPYSYKSISNELIFQNLKFLGEKKNNLKDLDLLCSASLQSKMAEDTLSSSRNFI